jgi:hypothetical protein
MWADITPEKARKCDDKLLTQPANQYRVGTGAHTVVQNEINRLKAWPIILVPIGVWLLSNFFG